MNGKIIQRANGSQIVVLSTVFDHINTAHGSETNSLRQYREIEPSYYTIDWWPEAVMQALTYGMKTRIKGNCEVYQYAFRKVIGYNPNYNCKCQTVCAIVRNGLLMTAFPI